MKMSRKNLPRWSPIIAVAVLMGVSAGACADAQTEFAPPHPDRIERAEVERVIRTLADDDMRGRQAFSEDALRAADFLADEFAAAGLSPLAGTTGHLQRFDVRDQIIHRLCRIGQMAGF